MGNGCRHAEGGGVFMCVRVHQWGVHKVCGAIKTDMQEVHGPTEIWLGSLWGIAYAIKHREMGCAWRGTCQGETRMVQVHQAGHAGELSMEAHM